MNGLIMDEMVKSLAKVGEAHAKTGELLKEKYIKTENSVFVGIKERLGAGVFDYENLLNKLLKNIDKLELVPEFEPEHHGAIPVIGTGYLKDLDDLVIVLEKHNYYFNFLIKHLSKLI